MIVQDAISSGDVFKEAEYMIYLTSEQALFTNDGRFIKRIDCPLASKLARAVSQAEPEREFHCSACSSKVKNLRFLTDDQAIEAVQDDSDVCFFATKEANNVVHLLLPIDQNWRSENEYRVGIKNPYGEPWPTIRTARGIEEMNFAVRNGFRVIPRKLEATAGTKGSVALCEDTVTGLFSYLYDWRDGWPNEDEESTEQAWSSEHAGRDRSKRVFDFFTYSRDQPVPPVAAYVVPRDLKPGTSVFLEDVIEHLVQTYPQESSERMPSWWGTWTGTDIVLEKFKEDLILG